MKEKKQILRSGFTLLEVVTALSVFALVMGGVFMAIYKIYGFVLFSKSEVLAINYAKSGMEGVMQIRDTNWRRYSSSRDEHWIRTNPFNHSAPLMQSGLYILLETGVKLPQPSPNPPLFNKFFLLSGASLGVEHWNYANFLALKPEERVEFLLTGDQWTLLPGSDFYRMVRVFGVFDKKAANPDTLCTACPPSDPQELRYCVKVIWVNRTPGEIELCSILTNFTKLS